MFDTLSKTQQQIVFEKSGKFVVRACPGSGKTHSVAARLAHHISNWELEHQGIAAISFTNAAWQEIQRQIAEHFQIEGPIPYPHFIGTIDSFINNFIFLPFGHLVMKCKSRPVLVGEPHGPWTGKFFSEKFFGKISYDIEGNLFAISKIGMPPNWMNNQYIVNAKKRLVKAGYANQEDANFYGMKILEEYPQISKAITCRFPMFMVDEAQDTSEIQMKIIDHLIDNGLSEVMLVGDPDQAIFEWHDAKPRLFAEKMEEWSNNSIVLNENRRSSQNICNFTYGLSSLDRTSTAINDDVRNCEFIPLISTYDAANMSGLIENFKSLCDDYEIEITPDKVAIIYRSKTIFNSITGINEIASNKYPWHDNDPYCKDFAKGKYLFDNGDFKKGFDLILKAVIKEITNSRYCSAKDIERLIEEYGFIELRKYIFELINIMHRTNCPIGDWVESSNKAFIQNNLKFGFEIKKTFNHISFDDLFGTDNKQITETNYRLGTIHSIKGETFEAVLVILKKKGIGRLYKTMLKENVRIQDNEELRIAYVGITRPRRLLMLAVPDQDNKSAWESRLKN